MERLGDILDGSVLRPAKRTRSRIGRARRKWVEVVGEYLAARSRPRSVRRGLLTVEADSSALLAELAGYRQVEILRGLTAGPRPLGIREIRFVLTEEEK